MFAIPLPCHYISTASEFRPSDDMPHEKAEEIAAPKLKSTMV